MCFFFFFSSRRRHTRSKRDWSSDVCSSDLFWKLVVPIFLLSTLSVLILSGGEATRPIPIQAQRHGFHQANRQSPANQAFLESYGKLPLSFEANLGQMDPSVKFLSRGSGYNLLLRGDEAVLTLRNA